MGAMFIGQQFLQNVLGYSTLEAGRVDPSGGRSDGARRAALGEARRGYGARFTLLVGYVFCLLGFLTMLLLWEEDISYWQVGLGYALIGIGVGLAGTPASHSLTGSVPVQRAGMASGTADLQRDLGGAIMQSIFGALLTRGTRRGGRAVDRPRARRLDERRGGADEVVRRRGGHRRAVPAVRPTITAAAKESFLDGDQWAYIAGIVAILLGPRSSFFCSQRERERELLAHTPPRIGARRPARVQRASPPRPPVKGSSAPPDLSPTVKPTRARLVARAGPVHDGPRAVLVRRQQRRVHGQPGQRGLPARHRSSTEELNACGPSVRSPPSCPCPCRRRAWSPGLPRAGRSSPRPAPRPASPRSRAGAAPPASSRP